MPEVTVVLPPSLTAPEPQLELACQAASVEEALRAAAALAPRFAPRIFYRGRLLVSVAVNGRHLPPAEARSSPLTDGDRLEVLPPVAGG